MKGCNRNGLYMDKAITKVISYILLMLSVIIIIAPICIVLNVSLKSSEEYMYSTIFDLPKNLLYFENYKFIIEKGKLLLGLKNTIILAIPSIIGSLIMGSMVAYVLNRFDFKLKKIVMAAFVLPIMIPSITTQVATFSVIKNLGLFNTIFSCMILYLGTDLIQIYVFLQFVNKIPRSLDESATLDGASYFRVYTSIIVPQLKPAVATVVIIKLIAIYNDTFNPFLYMPKPSLRTVTTAFMMFSTDRNTNWTLMSAGVITVLLPTLLIYLFLQKYIIAGASDGAVKL